jgi:hypothetical protein
MEPIDRQALLLTSTAFNGIDFVEIANRAQTVLRVHFLNAVPLAGSLSGLPTITGGETIRAVTVHPINDDNDWSLDDDHLVLTLTVAAPGDFSNYTLEIPSPHLDIFYRSTFFSFKARCRSDLDCKTPPVECPPIPGDVPPIDYLSKDFLGFRQALLDLSALRYPQWQERSEGDFGMMFLEALSSLADDLSYQQDRIAAEADLETATQRRSLLRMARLVDYDALPATSATVLLQFDVAPAVSELFDGLQVSARGPDGTSIPFETGAGLNNRMIDPATGNRRDVSPSSTVSHAWNRSVIKPYWFDDSQRCLRAGATKMYLRGNDYGFFGGQALLVETAGVTSADPPIRQIIHLVTGSPAVELCDPLILRSVEPDAFNAPPYLVCPPSPPGSMAPSAVTQIFWEPADKLLADRDLTKTILAGNLIWATQGYTIQSIPAPPAQQVSESFAIPSPPAIPLDVPLAVVRTGPNDTVSRPSFQYLYTLKQRPLAWLASQKPETPPVPEIILTGQPPGGEKSLWPFVADLLEAENFAQAFTIDPALYSPIASIADPPSPPSLGRPVSLFQDYDGDNGDTIRFGDSTFGQTPLDGSRFDVVYRAGGGSIGNVAPDSITQIGAGVTGVWQVTNPFAATGGNDAESIPHTQQSAPEAFRTTQFRAVLPVDYQKAAETLPWVEQAGTVFRWTGSWLTVFTTPDPLESEQATVQEQTELVNLLNRYRMAGYESYVPQAQYVSLDIVVEVCASPKAYRGDVESAVLAALSSSSGGFFEHKNFRFGQPLERSALEAAAQAAQGVQGVTCVQCRVRNRTTALTEMPDEISVRFDQIIRCDNDPSTPDRGSLKVVVQGGK